MTESSNIKTPPQGQNAASKTASVASFKKLKIQAKDPRLEIADEILFKRNPQYDKATHAIWWMGAESWEQFSMREFGKVIPCPVL